MTVNIKKIDEKIVKLFSSMFFALGKFAWMKFCDARLHITHRLIHGGKGNIIWRCRYLLIYDLMDKHKHVRPVVHINVLLLLLTYAAMVIVV